VLHELGEAGVNELFRALSKEKLVTDKRQVTKALERLIDLGLVDVEQRGQKKVSRLTAAGEAKVILKHVVEELEALKTLISMDSARGLEMLVELLSTYAGIGLSPSEKIVLAKKIEEARKRIDCKMLAEATLLSLGLMAYVCSKLSKTVEQAGISGMGEECLRSIRTSVELAEKLGCGQRLDDMIRAKVRTLEKELVQALAKALGR